MLRNKNTLRKWFIFILFIAVPIFWGRIGFAREMAITIDDLPLARQSIHTETEEIEIFNRVLAVLKKHRVKAIGFAVGNKITKDYHKELLDTFIKENHVIGNHTYSHKDINEITTDDYGQDILKAERILMKWLKPTKYFRYPMLHQGDTEEKQKAVAAFLFRNNYTTVPVTIDNDDYAYSAQLEKVDRKQNPGEFERIRKEYLAHMRERTDYFEKMAMQKIGREVKHILLIHMNELNALFLDELLTSYEKQGWKFVSVEEALTDGLYRMEDLYIGKKGLSWLERITR